MNWLKNKMFSYQLKNLPVDKKSNANQGQVKNLTSYIAVLFDEDQIDNPKEMSTILQKWSKSGKRIETFSFVDVKEFEETDNPDNKICKKDINWYGMPKGEKVSAFANKRFDILITINPNKTKHLHYLNAASKAQFKIGLLPDELEFYNLMIDCDKTNSIKKVFSDIQITLDKLAI